MLVYNRYIPQSDGTYRRSRIPEHRNEGSVQPSKPTIPHPPHQEDPPVSPPGNPQGPPPRGRNVEGFLRQILPKDFDTGDLLVILLLLLMSGDNKENQNNALLTLALYLFM
ncbi:MAG: hypothetical protein J6Q30_03430 [Oscillospiraceae bacterium]|nr:hypothetical protein [Oscillospiraceae bacterium]